VGRGAAGPVVQVSTSSIPGSKGGRCVKLTTSPPSWAECHENLGAETSWNPLDHTGTFTGILFLLIDYYWTLSTVTSVKYSPGNINTERAAKKFQNQINIRYVRKNIKIKLIFGTYVKISKSN
jgi:hypothetical protein